jgi:hypothetical protein
MRSEPNRRSMANQQNERAAPPSGVTLGLARQQAHDSVTTTATSDLTSQEDLIEEIAYQLRPWKCSKSDVLAKIRGAIEELQSDFAKAPDPWRGFCSKNREYADNILSAINNLKRQLTTPTESFFRGLLNADKPEEIKELNNPEKLTEDIVDLLSRLDKLAVQCRDVIAKRIGADPRADYKKTNTACSALFLMLDVSEQSPTAGSLDTSFCFISSLMFEAVTGMPEQSMRRACQKVLASSRPASTDRTSVCLNKSS